jgi:peptide/nickel transport system ATP-binding protein
VADDLLVVEDLTVEYLGDAGSARVLDRVSLRIGAGEVVGLCGESGCGKSTLAHALLRLLPAPAVIAGGKVSWRGRDLLAMSERELRRVRGREIALCPQNAMSALHPLLTVGDQVIDLLLAHEPIDRRAARAQAMAALTRVGLEPAHADRYPHELSGGMRHRVVIAMALALRPGLLLLDEPTAALDLVVQREILAQIAGLQRELGFAVLFVSHDLALTLGLAARVGVLYAGRLVETAPAETLRTGAAHPYTRALLACHLDARVRRPDLRGIPGAPPDPAKRPSGCAFHPRCPSAFERCRDESPALVSIGPRHERACHLEPG